MSSVLLTLKERVPVKGRTVTVTRTDLRWLPEIRAFLIGVARTEGTVTYGGLKETLGLPHAVQGLGRLLDLVGVDCSRRGEPSLASLVVTGSTGEVGAEYTGDAPRERRASYVHWAGRAS